MNKPITSRRTCAVSVVTRLPGAALLLGVALLITSAGAAAALPELIRQVKPAIVVIGTYARTRSPAFIMRGTGFVVGDGNTVATNSHVLPETLDAAVGETLVVQVLPGQPSMQQRPATSVARDSAHDLALLRIEGSALPALTLQNEAAVSEGQSVAFIGFPIGTALGLSPVTHRGIISAITPIALPTGTANQLNEKVIKRLRAGSFEVYQLDATAYPGNSGGPLFDVERGEVVAVINMVFVKGTKESALTHPSGISFAIPVQFLQELLRDQR